MADNRQYPDISFVDTNTDRLTNSLIKSYEIFTGRTLYPADPARLFILWIADIIIQERVIIDESAKQNVPRYAEGEYLDSIAELFKDTERLQAQAAKTTLRFYLSTIQPTTQIVPKGTRVTVDGEITFETIENLNITQGELYGDVSAVCQELGTIGNGFIPRQITQIVDLYPFYEKVENITTSEDGTNIETDAAFYDRMRESMETFSTAGPAGAYIYHTKTVSSKITDVVASSPEPGVVDIRILLENGELPDKEMIQLTKEALSKDKTRPLTDCIMVSAPVEAKFDIEVKYYIPKPRADSATVIRNDTENAIKEYIKWQTEKMGRDINPSRLISLLMATGIKRVEVVKPLYTVLNNDTVAVLNSQSIVYGGVEDE